MAERRAIVQGRVLQYSGEFNLREMFELIDQWFADHGFSGREEVEHMEKITKGHKEVEIFYQPSKKLSSYAKAEIRLLITISNLKRKVVELESRKTNMDEGELELTFDGILSTDYEARYESKPSYFVWRHLFDKFIKKTHSTEHDAKISAYIQELYTHLRRYLTSNVRQGRQD
ncbi:MAG: hypothetical protein ACOC32_03500 [Nanoarchaeota archaeon]